MFKNPTINLSALCNSCVKIAYFFRLVWSSRFFLWAAAFKVLASNSSPISTFIFFVNFGLKIKVQLVVSILFLFITLHNVLVFVDSNCYISVVM